MKFYLMIIIIIVLYGNKLRLQGKTQKIVKKKYEIILKSNFVLQHADIMMFLICQN